MNEQTVDVVIATIGRPSLETAIVAALAQTHPHTRCIVIGDGPQPKAKVIAERYKDRIMYLETKGPLRRAGNGVKEFWYNSDRCAPFFRYLDDDDWMPSMSVATQMQHMKDPKVVISICKMWMSIWDDGIVIKEKTVPGTPKMGRVGNGSVLVRTSAAKDLVYRNETHSDLTWIKQISKKGKVMSTDLHLYWYNQRDLHGKTR